MSQLLRVQKSHYNMTKANATFEGRSEETTKPLEGTVEAEVSETPADEVASTTETTSMAPEPELPVAPDTPVAE